MPDTGSIVPVVSAALLVLATISILGAMSAREGFASPAALPPPQVEVTNTMRVMQSLQVVGGRSEHNPQKLWTYFNADKTGRNLLRGDTEVRGNTTNVGDLRVGRNLAIGGTWLTEAELIALKRLVATSAPWAAAPSPVPAPPPPSRPLTSTAAPGRGGDQDASPDQPGPAEPAGVDFMDGLLP